MTSEYSAAVPGSISREKSKPVYGIDGKVVFTLSVWAFVSLAFLFPVLIGFTEGLVSLLLFSLFVGWWAIFIAFFRDARHIEKAILFLQYFFRTRRGEDVVAKYTQPLAYIMKSYPIEDLIECPEYCLIKYHGATHPWGVLFKVDPYKVSDDDLEAHQAQLTDFINSLPEGVKFSVINTSYVDDSSEMLDYIKDKANAEHLSRPQKEHLAQLYSSLSADETTIVDWTILISAIWDDCETFEDAKNKAGQYIGGIANGLQDTGLNCFCITKKTEIVQEFRRMLEAQLC